MNMYMNYPNIFSAFFLSKLQLDLFENSYLKYTSISLQYEPLKSYGNCSSR